MIETNEKFQETGNEIVRFEPSKKKVKNLLISKVFEPISSYIKEETVQTKGGFMVKKKTKVESVEYSPIKRLADENITWLALQWTKEHGNGKLPTRKQILDGIIEADK